MRDCGCGPGEAKRGRVANSLTPRDVSQGELCLRRLDGCRLAEELFQYQFIQWRRVACARWARPMPTLDRIVTHRKRFDRHRLEVVAGLQNCVRSGLALVDTATAIRLAMCESPAGTRRVREAADDEWNDDGLVRFLGDLVEFCQSMRLPLQVTRIGAKYQKARGREGRLQVPVRRAGLEIWDGWSVESQDFLAMCDDYFDVAPLVRLFKRKACGLHTAFLSELRSACNERNRRDAAANSSPAADAPAMSAAP